MHFLFLLKEVRLESVLWKGTKGYGSSLWALPGLAERGLEYMEAKVLGKQLINDVLPREMEGHGGFRAVKLQVQT